MALVRPNKGDEILAETFAQPVYDSVNVIGSKIAILSQSFSDSQFGTVNGSLNTHPVIDGSPSWLFVVSWSADVASIGLPKLGYMQTVCNGTVQEQVAQYMAVGNQYQTYVFSAGAMKLNSFRLEVNGIRVGGGRLIFVALAPRG